MKRRQAGAALMLVMWFVAALSIIALSLSAGARIDLRGTSQFVDMARVEALAQTASNLILLEFETDRAAFEQNFRREYQYDGHTLVAEIRPDGAFVNLNSAPRELLLGLFQYAAGLPEDAAEKLAIAVIEWRSPSATGDLTRNYEAAGVQYRPRHNRFEAPEDLLQVLGVEYEAYAKITGLLTVYGSSVGVDARYAPEALLSVLAGGQQDVARQVLLSREGGELDTNLMAMDQALIVRGNDATAYRIDISVTLDGTSYVRRAWYEQGGGGANNEPWWTRVQEPVEVVRVSVDGDD